MFLVKKLVSRLIFPMPLSLELIFVGLYLLWFTRRQRAGRILVTVGALLLTAFSYFFVGNGLIRPLEHRQPPFALAVHADSSLPAVRFIVVLGARANRDPAVPITSRVSGDLMIRLVEALRLHREFPSSKLILSGYNGSAEGLTGVAEALGVSPAQIIATPDPRDTEEEAHHVAQIVARWPFILVTSAAHMPRALGLFRALGLDPLPAPTDYLAPRVPLGFDDAFPNPASLYESQGALYEYLGLAWAKLRGRL